MNNTPIWEPVLAQRNEYVLHIKAMSTPELIEYALVRGHATPLERELAERLQRRVGHKTDGEHHDRV